MKKNCHNICLYIKISNFFDLNQYFYHEPEKFLFLFSSYDYVCNMHYNKKGHAYERIISF